MWEKIKTAIIGIIGYGIVIGNIHEDPELLEADK